MNLRNLFAYSALAATALGAWAVPPEATGGAGRPQTGDPISGTARLTLPSRSVKARIGERNPLVPPFIETFDDFMSGEEHIEFSNRFQVIDANEDTRSWRLYNYIGTDKNRSKCAYLLPPLGDNDLDGVPGRDTADDWLILRAIRLEEGKYYDVSVDASLYTDGGEHVYEVNMGYYNDAEGLDMNVIPATTVDSQLRKQSAGWFKAPDSGVFYLGVHAISERSKIGGLTWLFIDNIAVGEARTGAEPERVSEVGFTNKPDGSTAVIIDVTMPDKSIDGSALEGTVDLIVSRDGNEVMTIEGKKPGERVTVTDDPGAEGNVYYSFRTRNSAGLGSEYRLNHYAGFVAPDIPRILSFEDAGNGKVTLTWEAPGFDLNGSAIDADALRYNVYDFSGDHIERVLENYNGTSATIDIDLNFDGQASAFLLISAVLNGKESEMTASSIMVIGNPYSYPYRYSFTTEESMHNVITVNTGDLVIWRYLDDFANPKAQDGDGGYICMIGNDVELEGELLTGKIDMTGAVHPYVSFYTYKYEDDENIVGVDIIDCATGERKTVGTQDLKDFQRVGWNRVIVPIDEYAGRVIRVVLTGTIITDGYLPFDNLVIDEFLDRDLSVELVSASDYAEVGEEYVVKALVHNGGSSTVDSYEVRLLCNGEVVATAQSEAPLQPMASAEYELTGEFTVRTPDVPVFEVEVVAAGDQYESNDRTDPFNITFLAPIHPVVKDLKAEEADGGVLLSWSAPALAGAAPEEVLEDFESYPSFTTSLGKGWTMYDGDKAFVAGFEEVDYPLVNTRQAWWTVRNENGFEFVPARGNSSLVQMTSSDEDGKPVDCDDWIISPELYGGRQNLSFWARSLTITYGYETFEVYVSSTDNDPRSFTRILYPTRLEAEWTPFFVTLPEGTRYFAIRCLSYNCYMMLLDDITYIPAGTPRDYELFGYNVYRNDEKLNGDLVAGTTFVTDLQNDDDEYYVTAVYDRGESTASNVARLGESGIDGITAPAAPAEYFTVSGLKVAADALTPGIYIRRQGSTVSKVVIR